MNNYTHTHIYIHTIFLCMCNPTLHFPSEVIQLLSMSLILPLNYWEIKCFLLNIKMFGLIKYSSEVHFILTYRWSTLQRILQMPDITICGFTTSIDHTCNLNAITNGIKSLREVYGIIHHLHILTKGNSCV
jgi:hypothetical protein